MTLKLKYNAPLSLTFALAATLLLLADQLLGTYLIPRFFMVPGKGMFNSSNPADWISLISHCLGHASWKHLLSNLALLLLLGPALEEKYGILSMLLMIVLTAAITGVLNAFLFPKALMGASGIVFMMIILSSFTNNRNGEVPLTFVLILVLYLSTEFINALKYDDISQFAHIIGGICGSLFGFLRPRKH